MSIPSPTDVLYYAHDPMCSWCWAYRPLLLKLRENLPGQVRWQNVLGGLAPDTEQPMPEQTRQIVQAHWRKIQSTVGTEFNFDFWSKCQPRRDTYKACRAVIAASRQNAEEAMIEAIQKAYYLRAMNPSEPETLAELAIELGLNRDQFIADMGSSQTETAFQSQLSLFAKLGVKGMPSLVLEHDSVYTAITVDFHNCQPSLMEIQVCLARSG